MSKLITFPTSTPQPPRPSVPFLLRIFRKIIAIWKTAMSKEYRDVLPVIIPEWWSVDRVIHFANGGQHTPAFVATIGTRVNVRRRGIGQLELQLTA